MLMLGDEVIDADVEQAGFMFPVSNDLINGAVVEEWQYPPAMRN